MKKCSYLIFFAVLGVMLVACDNSSPYHEFADAEDRCVFRVPLAQGSKNYELKFDYLMALLMQKTFDAQDHDQKYIPKYDKKSKYVEFDMQKNCKDIVAMIVEQL